KNEGAHAEDREMNRARRGHRTPRTGDLAHHQRRLGDPETAAAVLLGNRDAQPPAARDFGIELVRELGACVAIAPVFIGKLLAHPADLLYDLLLRFDQFKIHLSVPCQGLSASLNE